MATDSVMVERDQQIKAIPHVGDLLRTGADRKKTVATPNDRLVGVISVQMQATAT